MGEPGLVQLKVPRPWELRVTAQDDALSPSIGAGTVAVVDCNDRELIDGEIVAVRHGAHVQLWLWQDGFAGLGRRFGGREAGALLPLAGRFRYVAPVEPGTLEVVGRVIGTPGSVEAGADPALGLAEERRALLLALVDAEAERREIVGDPAFEQATVLPENATAMTPADLRAHLAVALSDPRRIRRFVIEQRIDALETRLLRVEDRLAAAATRSLAGVKAKLELLWDRHYALREDAGDRLGRSVLGTALSALAELAPPAALAEAGDPPCGDTSPDGVSSLRVVSSPRRRG